jgi:hypothetical protein
VALPGFESGSDSNVGKAADNWPVLFTTALLADPAAFLPAAGSDLANL